MRRLAEDWLNHWAQAPTRKPLILRGARQVGKTWLVSHFSQRFAHQVVVANLEREPDLLDCFHGKDPRSIVALLEVRLRCRIKPGESLLFIDEVQAAPEIISTLRWFYEELPALHVIVAGSLIDFALADHTFSMPVGRISYGHLEPMTFAEFLLASQEERLLEVIRSCTLAVGVPEALHARLMELLRIYCVIGGLPEAVQTWVSTRSFAAVTSVHSDLLQSMRDDFNRYGVGTRTHAATRCVDKVFAAMPRLVGRKFMPTEVDREEKSAALKHAFRRLSYARVVTAIQRTRANGVPLGAEIDGLYQKVCFLDIGLFCTMCGLNAVEITAGDELTLVHAGQCAEQLVGQELRAARLFNQEPALYTWIRESKDSNAEVDFVLQVGSRIVPIEVKAGASGRLRSLHMMVAEKGLPLGVRVCSEPMHLGRITTARPIAPQTSFSLLSIPFYLVSELPRLIAELPT